MAENVEFRTQLGHNIFYNKYALGGDDSWAALSGRVVKDVCEDLLSKSDCKQLVELIDGKKFVPGGRYLYYAGRPLHAWNNCYLLKGESDTREEWGSLLKRSSDCLMNGGGIGVDYSVFRPSGCVLSRTGGIASGPLPLMRSVNEVGRNVLQGGSRRSAIYASLSWQHGDATAFLTMKDWHGMKLGHDGLSVWDAKQADFNYPAPLDMTNISLNYDDDWLMLDERYKHPTYLKNVEQALSTGEPGFSFNFGAQQNETLRNACCEVVSEDDSDVCNLGSINMAAIDTLEEFIDVVKLGIQFLVCGTVRADLPYKKIYRVREKNRRLGLGLMGIHEWLLKRGYGYEVVEELKTWLAAYGEHSERAANALCKRLSISQPVAYRAIAPTGCQNPNTLIISDNGIVELGELGDVNGGQWQDLGINVAQEYNIKSELATRFFVNGIAKTKKIKLSSGTELEATPNHQYRVLSGGNYVWKRSDELSIGDLLIVPLNAYSKTTEPDLIFVKQYHHNEVEITQPLTMNEDLAWFIGNFFADGSIHEKGIRIHTNALTNESDKVIEYGKRVFGIEPFLENNGRNCLSVCFNSSHLLRWLYVNGLDKQYSVSAEIPYIIRTSSKQSIQSFIDGYWWGDGSKSKTGVYIDTASKKMAMQLLTVSRALGKDAAIQKHVSGLGSDMFRVYFVKTKRRCETSEVTKQLSALQLSNCTVDDVVNIEDGQSVTVDIEVPTTTTYIANGIVSHNTIGIMAGTSTGIEPLFAVAYKRRYLKNGTKWHYEYAVDATAELMIKEYGIKPESIETAYSMSIAPEKRIKFQADVQDYVDMAISSTINLPAWGTAHNNPDLVEDFAATLSRYAHRLRGFTAYPDGSRGGQPITEVEYETAIKHKGVVFEENQEKQCSSGVCGI